MTTPNTKNGITKDSTLLINVNPYLPNNYKQTLNYVGYWKWDSTNQTFIQVLNNQDIIDEKYNLKIQPLFYDADTGLPQKVTVNSGDTKRLKMVNDNNDGSMEPAEYIENNTMVKFNSKTRSVTEYPYFEVEALPPIITTPIENNGYYKFNGNNLISGTNQDYNLNINVSNIRKIDTIKIGSTIISNSSTNWHWFPYGQPYNVSGGQEVLIICKYGDWWNVTFHYNLNSNVYSTITVADNSWVYINNLNYSPYSIEFIENNQTFFRSRDDSGYDPLYFDFYKSIEFNIDWMTFN